MAILIEDPVKVMEGTVAIVRLSMILQKHAEEKLRAEIKRETGVAGVVFLSLGDEIEFRRMDAVDDEEAQ